MLILHLRMVQNDNTATPKLWRKDQIRKLGQRFVYRYILSAAKIQSIKPKHFE